MIFIRRLLHANSQIHFIYIYIYIYVCVCVCVCVCVVICVLDLLYCARGLRDEKNSSKAELEISGN